MVGVKSSVADPLEFLCSSRMKEFWVYLNECTKMLWTRLSQNWEAQPQTENFSWLLATAVNARSFVILDTLRLSKKGFSWKPPRAPDRAFTYNIELVSVCTGYQAVILFCNPLQFFIFVILIFYISHNNLCIVIERTVGQPGIFSLLRKLGHERYQSNCGKKLYLINQVTSVKFQKPSLVYFISM